jgi:hypothetical protein
MLLWDSLWGLSAEGLGDSAMAFCRVRSWLLELRILVSAHSPGGEYCVVLLFLVMAIGIAAAYAGKTVVGAAGGYWSIAIGRAAAVAGKAAAVSLVAGRPFGEVAADLVFGRLVSRGGRLCYRK